MPQSTTVINTVDAVVEVSTDGATWSNISGSTTKVKVTPQKRQIGAARTLEGQFPIVRAGKYEPVEIEVTLVYSETAAEGYALLYAQKQVAGGAWYFRYTPGGSNGDYRWYAGDSSGNKAPARIIEFPYVDADADFPGPQMVVFKMQATQLVREAATPSPSASVSPSASASS